MILSFTLSMPNRGSWNGRWSGEDSLYVVTRTLRRTKEQTELGQRLLAKGSFYYSWGDGWGASVAIKEVSSSEARSLRARSKGFSGYEWMVESLLRYEAIYADHQIPEAKTSQLVST